MDAINITNVSFNYGKESVLRDLSIDIAQGAFVAIAGPNGAGKSTLVNLLSGMLRAHSGSISISGKDIKSYSLEAIAKEIAVVRQEFLPVFGFTVLETVAMARTPYLKGFGFETPKDRQIIDDALIATDTFQFAGRRLGQLSGGERQRVLIARAIAQQSPLLLLDEPTSFLDLKHQVDIYDLLKRMQRDLGKTIVLISHDINVAAQYCDSLLLLGSDKQAYFGAVEDIFKEDLIRNVFGVCGFAGMVGKEKFFIPLGKYAKDREHTTH